MTRKTMQYKLPASWRGLVISALAAGIVAAPIAASAQGRGRGSDGGSDRGSNRGSDSSPRRDTAGRSDSSSRSDSHASPRVESRRSDSSSSRGTDRGYSYQREEPRYTPRESYQGSYGRGDTSRGGADPFVHDRAYGYSRGTQ